jgi:hypothetical protein
MKNSRKDYRKIWIDHYGPIPKDEHGKSYDIHHIDGNIENNDISNLIALSIKEHYKIHYDQGDYNACSLLLYRMTVSKEELKLLYEDIGKKLRGRKNLKLSEYLRGPHHYMKRVEWREKQAKRNKNPKTHPLKNEVSRKKLSASKTGEGNNMYGKKGYLSPVSKSVLQYDKLGNFIKEWECAREASMNTKATISGISKVCSEKQYSSGGFIWKFKYK